MNTASALILLCYLIQLVPVLLHGDSASLPRRLPLRHSRAEESNHTPTSRCREAYNYKHPHPCVPGTNCDFVVKWQTLQGGDWVEYELQGTLAGLNHNSTSLWVALGFSSNSKMGDTDVIACWHHVKTGEFEVKDGYNIPGGHTFTLDKNSTEQDTQQDTQEEGDQVTLLPNSGIENGVFTCKFRRKVETGDTLQDKLLSQRQYVLAAVGPLDWEGEGSVRMQRHHKVAASTCPCDVMSCDTACSCPFGFFYQLLKLHGIVMAISFMLLVPVGALLSRYYKAVFINAWFKAHVTVMVIGVLWSLVGLALVLTHTRGVFSVGVHQILGILVLTLGVLQPTIGFLRPLNKPSKLRMVFNIFHRSMAGIILLVSTVVLFWGVYLFHNSVLVFMFVTLTLYVLFDLGFLIFLEVLKRNQKFSSGPPVGYHKVVTQRDDTDSEEEAVYVKEEPSKPSGGPAHSMEKALLLLFVVVNLILAGLISIFIFYYDAEE